MAYTTINKNSLNFNTVLYTGNATSRNITGVGFKPDFTWIKSRSQARDNVTLNSVLSGWTSPNNTYANNTDSAYAYTPISDGFNIGTANDVNGNNYSQCAWNWKAGGSPSSNTNGSTTTSVSANTTAGFSIIKWTGTSGTTTIGHGLGVVPSMWIAKQTGASGTNWIVFHKSLTVNYYVKLNLTNAQDNGNNYVASTPATSSVITLASTSAANANNSSMIMYAFAEKQGYSKFGSYIGNGNANGTFVYTGFKPSFIMTKRIDNSSGAEWNILDNKRDTYNVADAKLQAQSTGTEATDVMYDILSNGFKVRAADGNINASGGTYIYMAFGQSLVGTNNVPATAR